MKFVGILGAEICSREEKKAIFQDFNLDVCLSKINSLVKGYDLLDMYQNIPKDPETVHFRRMITGDLRDEKLRTAFAQYSSDIEKARKQEKQSQYNNYQAQKEKWHVDALCTYVSAVETLLGVLQQSQNLSEEMLSLRTYLDDYVTSETYKQWRMLLMEVIDLFERETVTFSIQKNKVILEEQGEHEDFSKRMIRAFRVREREKSNKPNTDSLSRMERALAERVVRQRGLAKPLHQLMQISMDAELLRLATEIQYYLGFYKFVDFLKDKGYSFCYPQEGEVMSVQAGYDVAMAVKSERKVISNDFCMGEEERFFVITGANGGGKTTFARMIGQILYFFRMGLLVPCEGAVIPYFTDVLSHFSNEETEASGRGKLVEELVRLQPMMKAQNENCFVILNELFTTAATLDAGIMGQKVLTHFMEMNCRGIYVTHIQSLAEERDGVVSMVAELENDHHTRSFKIVRKPAREGEYEDSLITKYHMTYEQMKVVMRHED